MSLKPARYQTQTSAPGNGDPGHAKEGFVVNDVELTTSDGVALTTRVWSGHEPVKFTALMLPGIGVPQRAFRHLAGWLAVRGARCVTIDYRGMGQSATPSGISSASLSNWAQLDVPAAMTFCKKLGPEPVVLIGHSFGGQSVGLTDALHSVDAAVFIGSQFGTARNWDGVARWQLAAYWHLFLPTICSMYKVLPKWSGPAGPLPRGVAREWARWGRSADWYLSQVAGSSELLNDFAAPTLAFGISDDTIAPPRAVTEFLGRLRSAAPIRRNVDPAEFGLERIGHTGLLRPLAQTEVIWQEIHDFLVRSVATGARAA